MSHVLNPKDSPWNAKGDGVADDQSALQACFNAAKAGGHSVLIPAGTYNHSSSLTVDSIKVAGVNGKPADGPVTMLYATDAKYRAIRMIGSGAEITKMRLHSWPQFRRPEGIGASPWLSMVLVDKGTRNFRITHIWIEGDNKQDSLKNNHGIFCTGTNNGYIGRNTIMYTTADAIHVKEDSSTTTSHHHVIEYNYVWQSGDDGTAFVGYYTHHVEDSISRYNYVGGNRGGRGVTAVGSKRCTLLGNLIEGSANERAGIMIASEASNYHTGGNHDLLVQDNTVYRAGGSGVRTQLLIEENDDTTRHAAIHIYNGEGLATESNNQNVQIIGNQIFESKQWGIQSDGAYSAVSVTALRNQFYNCFSGTMNWARRPTTLVAPTSGTDANSANLSSSSYPGNKALGGAASRTIAAQRVGCNTTWTAGGGGTEPDPEPEPIPMVYLPNAVSVSEGSSTTITVTKSGTGACSVTVATAAGTATTADFTPIAATVLSFGASEVTKTVTLQTTADALSELNETVNLVLSSPAGCTISNATCVVTIIDSTIVIPENPIPLPYQPRTAFDVTVNLNTETARVFAGATYAGKHVRVIPKTTMDTGAGLYFDGCASVTIIGGHFSPASRAVNGTIDSGASLYFNACGKVYLEGLLVNNASIAQGHAVLVHARSAETEVILQNCRLVNVTGSDAGIRGTIFSTGTVATGRTGGVVLHNVTASTNAGTRGIYVPPETGGGIGGLLLRNVNLFRANPAGGFGFFHFLNSATDFQDFGYTLDFDNVWGAVTTAIGQTIEAQGVWPNNAAGSNAAFGAKFAAVRAPNPLDGNKVGVHWPGMDDPGANWEGFIYEGAPAQGDFVPAAKVGLVYAPGIDLVEKEPPNPVPDPDPEPLPETVTIVTIPNLIIPDGWTTGGASGVAVDRATGEVRFVKSGATKSYARYVAETKPGVKYWLVYSQNSATLGVGRQIGTTAGTGNIVAYAETPGSDIKIEFTAPGTETHIEFSRSALGTVSADGVVLHELVENRTSARRLNGRDQSFRLDTFATGLRSANYLWYIGGWVRLTYGPAAAIYLLDFGRADVISTVPGAGRVRIVYDPLNSKILASTASFDGLSYRETSVNTTMIDDAWYYVSLSVRSDGDIGLAVNGIAGSDPTGTIPAPSEDLCRVLRLGARIGATTGLAPAQYSDWIWCSNFIPDLRVIRVLTAGIRPTGISDFTPTYHWPMVQTGAQEVSVARPDAEFVGTVPGTPLVAEGSPTTVVGLSYKGSTPPTMGVAPLLNIIII
jgi:hypothetical protein